MSDIDINMDWKTGSFKWTSNELTAKQTLWLMTDTLIDMYRYFFKEPMRPEFYPQPSRVCIELKEDKLGIAFRPEDDVQSAISLTAAALVALSERAREGPIDPYQVMFGSLIREVKSSENGVTLS